MVIKQEVGRERFVLLGLIKPKGNKSHGITLRDVYNVLLPGLLFHPNVYTKFTGTPEKTKYA